MQCNKPGSLEFKHSRHSMTVHLVCIDGAATRELLHTCPFCTFCKILNALWAQFICCAGMQQRLSWCVMCLGAGWAQDVIVDGDSYMEYIEMGGRSAREQLRMKLPTFGAAPAAPRRTDSLLNEVEFSPSSHHSTEPASASGDFGQLPLNN